MLKHIADLSDANEYFIGWTGQSTSRPWGTKAEGFTLFSDYRPDPLGINVAGLAITTGTGTENVTTTTTLEAREWIGAHIRIGTNTSPLVGYGLIVDNDAGSLDVEWIVSPATGTGIAGIISREDYTVQYPDGTSLETSNGKWATFPQVRILTPYQPTSDDEDDRIVPYPTTTATIANGGRRLSIPGFTTPSGLTSFEDAAVLLPLTFLEGIDSYGISENNGGGVCTGVSATQFNFTTSTVVNYFTRGYLRVEWEDGGAPRLAWARIASNSINVFTLDAAGWQGDDPSAAAAGDIKRWTAWVPHYNNSPFAYLPGEGFTYPNNDMQPCAFSTVAGPVIHNRARGNTSFAYNDQFGEIIVMATRLAMATGKRINVVHLGINAAALAPSTERNTFGFQGKIGWYDQLDHLTHSPPLGSSGWARTKKLIGTCVANAMAAEGNTKPAKFLMWFYAQGESDALNTSARLHYKESLRSYKQGVRNLLDATTVNGETLNPYTNGAKVPFVQPKILRIGYELKGTFTYYGIPVTFDGDNQSLVNNAIKEEAARDEFSDWIWADDCPRKLPDANHFNGVGECVRASRTALRSTELIDHALGFGSPALVNGDSAIVEICNRALNNIGEGHAIQSLAENSTEAKACRRFLAEARDSLLQLMDWNFALRRRRLTEVKMPDQPLYTHFGRCYVLPEECLNIIAVLNPDEVKAAFDDEPVTLLTYSDDFVAAFDEGMAQTVSLSRETVAASNLPLVPGTSIQPQQFEVERSPYGGSYIFTDQEQAILHYVERVSDATEYSPAFAEALSLNLAAKLAGALTRGAEGQRVAGAMLERMSQVLDAAAMSDAQQGQQPSDNTPFGFSPSLIEARK